MILRKKKLVKKTPTFTKTHSRFRQKRIVVFQCLTGPVPLVCYLIMKAGVYEMMGRVRENC